MLKCSGMRIWWLVLALVLSVLLFTANYIAMVDYLYWRFVWIDVPIHFFGGLTIGVFVAAFLNAWRPRLFTLLITSALVGWELFEYFFGIPREANYVFDTALDVLMGTLGAVVVYLYARISLWRSA